MLVYLQKGLIKEECRLLLNHQECWGSQGVSGTKKDRLIFPKEIIYLNCYLMNLLGYFINWLLIDYYSNGMFMLMWLYWCCTHFTSCYLTNHKICDSGFNDSWLFQIQGIHNNLHWVKQNKNIWNSFYSQKISI